jgi:hypothetical protein
MAPIPPPTSHTVQAIYDAYAASNSEYEAIGISAGTIGKECSRAIWYDFRYVSPPEKLEGRKIRIFRRGDIEETRIIEDLESVGAVVTDRQAKVRAVGGHIRGKIDGQVSGLTEAPKTVHVLECKSSNDKNFKPLKKNGVEKAKPEHYATMQLYMHLRGLDRAFYACTNKNDEEYYSERVKYDAAAALRLLAKGESIIRSDDPPAKISEKPDFFMCKWCRHAPVCHEGAWPRVNCRTCLRSTPEMSGDAAWSCSRWNKPLSLEEQKAGCPTHLFLSGLVPGAQVDSSDEEEWVSYVLKDGTTWRDGGQEKVA